VRSATATQSVQAEALDDLPTIPACSIAPFTTRRAVTRDSGQWRLVGGRAIGLLSGSRQTISCHFLTVRDENSHEVGV
jgi:hypothetical protein